MDDPKQIVARGYDRIAERYAAWTGETREGDRARFGGLLIAAMGARESDAWYEEDWLGAPMYWSHYDGAANLRLIESAGLRLLLAEETTQDEDGVPATFLWIVAEKPRLG